MSWLSELTGIHISAPPAIQHLGDQLTGFALNAVPGGGTVDSLFDFTNTHGGGPTPGQLLNQGWGNIQSQVQTGIQAANAASAAQNAVSDVTTGLQLLLRNPFVLLTLVVVVIFLLLRRRS